MIRVFDIISFIKWNYWIIIIDFSCDIQWNRNVYIQLAKICFYRE